jgi:hypothetical protein
MQALATIDTADTVEPARYRVAVWTNTGENDSEPISFYVATPALAAAAVIWLRPDPSVTQIITTDIYTGRQLTVWTR